MYRIAKLSAVAGLVALATVAHADTLVVNATDVIYAVGNAAEATTAGGTLPVSVAVLGGGTITFSSVTGLISLDGGLTTVGPDGDGAVNRVSTSSNTGFGNISGVTGYLSGYLVGVFVGPDGPIGAAPAALDFTTMADGEAFTSLSPLLDQTFIIGDGLTGGDLPGMSSGTLQSFVVPTGATALYLGISDAGGFNGNPGNYGDNSGSFTANFSEVGGTPITTSAVPEPSSLALLGTGVSALMSSLAIRRKRAV